MTYFPKGAPGVFTAEQVKQMRNRLHVEMRPGETAEERANRAEDIIRDEEERAGIEDA